MPSKFDDAEDEQTALVDMEKVLTMQGEDPLVLAQSSGPGHPRAIRVLPLQEVLFGRQETCQICLDESAVSRQHAKIVYLEKQPEIMDCGSTNGTYLNGKKIRRSYIKDGDRIQVGSSVFDASLGAASEALPGLNASETSPDKIDRIRTALKGTQGKIIKRAPEDSVLSGNLKEIRLPSLLQILESNRNTGSLVIRQGDVDGHVFMESGRLTHAAMGRARGAKALYRMMALAEGSFQFYIPGRSPEEHTLEGSLQRYLLEAMRELDEFPIYKTQLPPESAVLIFNPRKVVPLHRIPPKVFEVLAAISRHRTVGGVMERCPISDLDVSRILIMLIKQGILLVQDADDEKTEEI